MELVVRELEGPSPGELPVEVVERKGTGHPDTICDALAERISVRLSRHYQERFGQILHHNVDKILLCGGASRPAFGGGEVIEPIELYLGGRATAQHAGITIPIHELAERACREWLEEYLPELDVARHVRVFSRLRPGSSDLVATFQRGGAVPRANDTSCGAGFAPLTELERAVLSVEQALNSADTRRRYPAIGRDIKVMGVRRERRIALTIGCAMIGRHLRHLDDYASAIASVRSLASEAARRVTSLELEVRVNAADDLASGDVFLTVTGTSAEAGDDGQVGRGNRVGGLITPYRPMTLEAAAGKNPVSHVGKLYQLVAMQIAQATARELPGLREARCVLLSAIGEPVDEPQLVDIALRGPGLELAPARARLQDLAAAALAGLPRLRQELLDERCVLF